MNERCESVADLLDRGLNDEAIQLAEQAPPIAELAMTLDFPELSDWLGVLTEFEIAHVPDLPHETIAQLEDAYSTTADSKKLLQRFRMLSLSRAPLPARIDVLRRLSSKDPGNDQWKTGIVNYETHRLKTIERDLKAAFDRKDLSAVSQIDRELNQASWSVKVGKSLKSDAHVKHSQLRQADARKRLKPLADQLSSAYAEFNVPQASELVKRFRALEDIANLPVDHEILDVAGPALDWIEEETRQQHATQQRQLAISQLQAGLDRNAPLLELENLYYQATEGGESVPAVLETRLANKIAASQAAAKRKRVAMITGSVTGLLILLTGLVLFIRQLTFNARVSQNATQISQLLKDAEISGNTAPLEEWFETLSADSPDVLASPEIAALQKQLQSLQKQEEGRVRSFNTLLAAAQQVADNPEWANLASGEASLQQADELTKNENERAAMLEVRQKLDVAKAGLRRETDKRFTDELDAVQTLIQTVDRSAAETYDIPINRLTAALKLQNISVEALSQGKALLNKLNSEKHMASQSQLMDLDLAAIGRNAKSLMVFNVYVDKYLKNHPGDVRTVEIQSTRRADSKVWSSVEEWNKFRVAAGTSLKNMSAEKAKTWLTSFAAFSQTGYPGSTNLETRQKIIQAIAQRKTSTAGTTNADIKQLFSSRYMRNCYVVMVDGDAWYYLDSPPTFEGRGNLRFKFYENGFASAAEGAKTLLPPFKIKNVGYLAERTTRSVWLSGQSKLGIEIEKLNRDRTLPFEEKIDGSVGLALNARGIDPLLQLVLVESLLRIGSTGSVFIAQQTKSVTATLNEIDVPRTADWVNPELQLKSDRADAQRELRNNATLIRRSLAKAMKARDENLKLPLGPAMKLVGWIHKDRQDQWVIALNQTSKIPKDRDLFMFWSQNGKPTMSRVGQTTSDRPALSSAFPRSELRQGRPVYIKSN